MTIWGNFQLTNTETLVKTGLPEYVIDYRYYPVGISSLKKEICIHFTPKIKELYEANKNLDKIMFSIYLPYRDTYGNETWKATARFTMTRKIYSKINWDNFFP